MQVFRLMDMPDRVIAFDELPARLLEGFELCRADGFPRHWKEWLGKTKRTIKIPPEKDFLTGQVRKYEPIVEEDYFFYLVDWTLGPVEEKWKEVCDYVRQHVSKDIRLKERIEDMAVHLAANKSDGVTLEPEQVMVIPLPKEEEAILGADGKEIKSVENSLKCCDKEFANEHGLVIHKRRMHKKESVTA